MRVLEALLKAGVEATLIGGEPTNEAEFAERVTIHKGTPPSWDVLQGAMSSGTTESVNAERDRRIAAGFVFGGTTYQTDAESRENIAGVLPVAMAAIQGGAIAGNLRWLDPDEDFAWTATDNSRVPMDAPTCMAFSIEAARYKAALIKAASDIKALSPIPGEYANDQYWPAGPST